MKKGIIRKTTVMVLIAALLCAFMPAAVFAAEGDTQPEPEKNCALTTEHVKYISPDSLGKFKPSAKLTKAKAAEMIYNLLAEKPEGREYCKDVTRSTSGSDSIAALLYLDVAETDSNGYFHPTKNITKGQLEKMLYKCLNKEGASSSTDKITKGAAVRLINKALGRGKTDKNTILKGNRIRPFTDVLTTNTYYYDIMEASITHTPSVSGGAEVWTDYVTESQGISGTGWKVIDGETYYIDKTTKVIKRNATVKGSKLDKNGRYTTGLAKLDKELTKVFKSQTKNSMTNRQKLKAIYTYLYKQCAYRTDVYRKVGTNSWDKEVAYKMLKNKKGNCYYYAAATTYAARKCGYNAKTISGYVLYRGYTYPARHGWCEIKKDDGTKCFVDTELQYLSYKGGWGCDYFMRPYGTMNKMRHKHYYKMGVEVKK